MSDYKLLINGELVDGAGSIDVINPATGKPFDTAPKASEAQLNEAVAAAKAAFPAWAALSFEEREAKLNALADAVEANAEELTRLLVLETGKPVAEAAFEPGGFAMGLRAFAAMRPEKRLIRETDAEKIIEIRRPLGVAAAIVPWNFPLMLLMMKLGPALITGNTMVAKTAPSTPLATLKLGEIASKILPAGVFNIIVDDNDLGPKLTTHPDVAKIGFTGSTATGMRVLAGAAADLKRVTLELGGNDAALVLDDADIAAVAPFIFGVSMANAGQVCTAVKRVYVPSSMYDAFCEAIAAIARDAVVGDGSEQGVTMGPLQNKAQFDKVRALIEETKSVGEIIAGGDVLDGDGYFIKPTIVKNIADDARLVREEQFGPVLPILKYDDLDDAIARINDSEFGLAGSVWTSNPERGIEIAGRIESGTVWVNKALETPFDVPFRGAKHSGIGGENGEEAINAYTQATIINAAL